MKYCREILETVSYHTVKPELSISPGLDYWHWVVTDGQTDGQTDRITVANTRYSYASSRA